MKTQEEMSELMYVATETDQKTLESRARNRACQTHSVAMMNFCRDLGHGNQTPQFQCN